MNALQLLKSSVWIFFYLVHSNTLVCGSQLDKKEEKTTSTPPKECRAKEDVTGDDSIPSMHCGSYDINVNGDLGNDVVEEEVGEDHDYYDGEEDDFFDYGEKEGYIYNEDEVILFDDGCFDDLCTTGDFSEKHNCEKIMSNPRPVHNESIWMLLRGTYTATVGYQYSSIHFPPITKSGFLVEVYVSQTDTAGRGVYAKNDISKGQLVWTSTIQSAHFATGGAYRHFLSSLPSDLICDLLIWCYPMFEDDNDENSARIACDLDEGSFVNDADDDYMYNFGCDRDAAKDVEGGCKTNFFATRDIMAGEEIRAWYGEFAHGAEWDRFGL